MVLCLQQSGPRNIGRDLKLEVMTLVSYHGSLRVEDVICRRFLCRLLIHAALLPEAGARKLVTTTKVTKKGPHTSSKF